MEGSGHSPLETQTVRHGMVAWTLGQSILGVSPQLPMDASLRDMTTDASSVVRHLDPTGTSNDNPGHSHHTAVSRLIQTTVTGIEMESEASDASSSSTATV